MSERIEALGEAFEVISIDEPLARSAGQLRQEYGTSHGIGLAEALIGASAMARELVLVTFNLRHFPMVEELTSPYVR